MDMDNFIEAFSEPYSSCYRQCACGAEFYNSDGQWDFEPGELEQLERGDAIDIDFSIGTISFEGKEYVLQCSCWHERAEQIMQFVDSHSHGIAKYINAERKRTIEQAEAMPAITDEG